MAGVNTFVNHISRRPSGSGLLVLQPTIPGTPGYQIHSGILLFLLVLQAAGPDLGWGWDLGWRWGRWVVAWSQSLGLTAS